jgi:hypothetical protein
MTWYKGLMNTLQLDIDGFIGNWGYSKSFVKNFLAAAGKDPVIVRVSSLGGGVLGGARGFRGIDEKR